MWPARPGTQRSDRLVPDRPRDQVGREWRRCWPAARFRATGTEGKEAGQGGLMWSHHTPLRSVGSCRAPPGRFWCITSHPRLCWERAFLPWGGSCLRSHLTAASMAEAECRDGFVSAASSSDPGRLQGGEESRGSVPLIHLRWSARALLVLRECQLSPTPFLKFLCTLPCTQSRVFTE